MTANERRAEIMRILVARRAVSEKRLAVELGVTRRTIHADIRVLIVNNPIEIVMGRAGGVRLPDWYHPHRRILAFTQERVIKELLSFATAEQQEVLLDIVKEFGSGINPDHGFCETDSLAVP